MPDAPRPAPATGSPLRAAATRSRIRRALLRWYHRHRRDLPWRRTTDAYEIWVSEIMLQQTRVAVALPYFRRFLERFPDLRALARADDEAVLSCWSGLGYYRRALMLRDGARRVVERHGGSLPANPAALLEIPGIGRYTAGAIASIAFGIAEPAVDGNARRVLGRLLGRRRLGVAGERAVLRLAGDLVEGTDPGGLNQALMELGALVCAPRDPRCAECPLSSHCRARAAGAIGNHPRPRPSRPPERVRVAVAVVEKRGRILVERRGGSTPLRGAWDLPAVVLSPGADASATLEAALERRHGVLARATDTGARVAHSILHRRLRIEAFSCTLDGPAPRAGSGIRWIDPSDPQGAAVSGATRKVLRLLAKQGVAEAPIDERGRHDGARGRPFSISPKAEPNAGRLPSRTSPARGRGARRSGTISPP